MDHFVGPGHGEEPKVVGGSGGESGCYWPLCVNDIILNIAGVVVVNSTGFIINDLLDKSEIGISDLSIIVCIGKRVLHEFLGPLCLAQLQNILDDRNVIIIDRVVAVGVSEDPQAGLDLDILLGCR